MICDCGEPGVLRAKLEEGVRPLCGHCATRLIYIVAAERTAQKKHYASTRAWAQDRDLKGLMGEASFARQFCRFGAVLDLCLYREGDGRIDSTLSNGWTVDVKTAKAGSDAAGYVRLEPEKRHADIMVAATWDGRKATLERWHYARRLLEEPITFLGPYVVPWHALKLEECYTLETLETLLRPVTPADMAAVLRSAFR